MRSSQRKQLSSRMTKRLQTLTLGCSKNKVDTEHVLSQVSESYCPDLGYEVVPEGEDVDYVDVLLINTCGFIGDAKEESVQAILEAVERKKNGQIGRIIVFGCLSQRYMAELPGLIPEVDSWFGARDLDPVIRALGIEPAEELKTQRLLTTPSHYAYLKISEGCDRRCSYCAIPFIRGGHKSVPMEELVREAENLASQGVRELIVIAQDTTYYGLDLYRRRALAELLQKLSEVDGIEWIRIHYSYPAAFPEDVLDQMANNPKVCRYMDIPLQHISDRVLDNMHRHVDGAWTRELIGKMRERVPGVVLRTTMIVGHPGENEADFEELLDFAQEAHFERLGAFMYSEEEGTYGAEYFEDSIPADVKQERLDELMALQSGISLAFNESRVGSEIQVIVDDFVDGIFVCRSEFESPEVDGEILVKHDSSVIGDVDPYSLIGEFVKVKVTGADEYDLIAELLEI